MQERASDRAGDTLERIEHALGRLELRVRQLQAKAATADVDRAKLSGLQADVAGAIDEIDRLLGTSADGRHG